MIATGVVIDIAYDAECIDSVTVQYSVKGVPYVFREHVRYNSNGHDIIPAIGEITTGIRVRVEHKEEQPNEGHLFDNIGLIAEDTHE